MVLASIKKKKRRQHKDSFKHGKNVRYCKGKEKIGYVNILKKYKEETKVQQIPAKGDTDGGKKIQFSVKESKTVPVWKQLCSA